MSFYRFLKYIPFLRFTVALALGIYLAVIYGLKSDDLLYLSISTTFLCLLGIVYVPFIFQNYRNRWLVGGFFLVMLLQLGMILGHLSLPSRIHQSMSVEASAKVLETDVTASGYYRFTVNPFAVKAEEQIPLKPGDHWVIVVEPCDSSHLSAVSPGDEVSFKTHLSGHNNPANPGVFNYGQYLFRQGVSATGFVKSHQFEYLGHSSVIRINDRLRNIRGKAREIYESYGIEDQNLQVLSALTLGMRDKLSDEVRNRFVHSGAIHILAVSGLHVGIIFLFLNALVGLFLPRNSWANVLIVITGLVFFALLAGGSPSVFRAVVMLSVVQAGRVTKHRGNIFNLLGISAFIILLVKPLSLFHAGFWLSHLAVAGIVTFYPVFRKMYAGGNLFIRSTGDLASVSLSAQLGTLPLSIFLFRAFPLWFLLSNFFLLPLVAPILILAKFLIGFSEFPFLASMLAGVLDDLLGFMNEMVTWLDALPLAYIRGLWMGLASVLFFYLLIMSWGMWLYHRSGGLLRGALFSGMMLALLSCTSYLNKKQTDAFVVFDAGRENVVGVIRSGKGRIFTSGDVPENQLGFICSGFFSEYALESERRSLFRADTSGMRVKVFCGPEGRYAWIEEGNVDQLRKNPKGLGDLAGVVIAGDVEGDVPALLRRLGRPPVIVGGGCPPWNSKKWLDDVQSMSVPVHSISEAGAYVDLR